MKATTSMVPMEDNDDTISPIDVHDTPDTTAVPITTDTDTTDGNENVNDTNDVYDDYTDTHNTDTEAAIRQLQALLQIEIPDDIAESMQLISQWLNDIDEAGETPFNNRDFLEALTALEAFTNLIEAPPHYSRIITNLEELHYFGAYALSESHFITGSTFTIRRIYRLPFDTPEVIRLDGFTSGGLDFAFESMERISDDGISRRGHSIIVEKQSNTSDPAEIRSRLPDYIHHRLEGYEGVLFLVEDSITTTAMEAQWERFYQEEIRIYQNLNFGDTSGFAVFFIQDDIGFTITNIDWRPQSYQSDRPGYIASGYEPFYTAYVTYTGWYSQLTIPGFITRAVYAGEVFNFEHFPSVLYKVSFTAPIDGVDGHTHFEDEDDYGYAYETAGPYTAHTTYETYTTADQDQPGGIAIHPLAIWVLIFGVIAILLFLAVRFRLLRFSGLKSIFKKDEDDHPEEFTENDNDRFKL